MLDFRQAQNRRRFYLERGLRHRPFGAGSNLRLLMDLPRYEVQVKPEELFGDIPAVVIGGVAARAYAPERHTKDIDFLIDHSRFEEASERLRQAGFRKDRDLFFPNASLALYGRAWSRGQVIIDVVATPQLWGKRALEKRVLDQTGLRVVPLPYLVLMKLDSARGIDQGDLTRMLGRLNDGEVEEIIDEVERYSSDPAFADDVRQYAQLGRWEWETDSEGLQG